MSALIAIVLGFLAQLLKLHGLGVAVLCVLNEEHHEEGDEPWWLY